MHNKKIELDSSGFDEDLIPADQKPVIVKAIGEAIKFSICHSIELPDERFFMGKPEAAKVVIANSAGKETGKPGVTFVYNDDGKGIDFNLLHELTNKATQERGNSQSLSKTELLSHLFDPDFVPSGDHSTDVKNLVKMNDTVETKLNGKLNLSYQDGQSFSFELHVPDKK